MIQNPFQLQEMVAQKESILDIKALDNSGCWYDLEVQIVNHPNFRERLLYYWSRIYGRELVKGENYEQLRRATVVVFTKFPIWPEEPGILYDTFQIKSKFNPARDFSDHLKIHCITVPDIIAGGPVYRDRNLFRWLKLLNYPALTSEEEMNTIATEDSLIESALVKLKTFMSDPTVIDYIEGKQKFELQQATIQQSIARENLAKGEKIGLAKGEEIGLAKGEEIGRTKEAISTLLEYIKWTTGELPDSLRSRIESITTYAEIKHLSAAVMKNQVKTLEELEQLFGNDN